jgi:cyclohexanone monooxygenase
VVIGAGFSGLRMLMHARDLGLSVCVLEAGTDVGGTWYWNRYPGARTDSEAWYYCYSFSEKLLADWNWNERYPGHQEMRSYLGHVADRFDLRRDIRFESRVTSARYLKESGRWEVTTQSGQRLTGHFLVSGMGILSNPYKPDFKGLDQFKGEWYQTARWPRVEPDFRGKRVGIIGTGATAIQAIPIIAQTAGHLTVFQRTPNYVVPARNHPLDDAKRGELKGRYDQIWDAARGHPFGMPFQPSGKVCAAASPEEREKAFEEGWQKGGFRYLFETYDDILVNQEANDAAAEFIRRKIRETVKDPVTAELLCPQGYPYATKRPPVGHFYYEAFNRDNVTLVDVSSSAIEEITPTGIRTRDSQHELDVIIFATGFDVFTGALTSIDIIGEQGRTLKEKFQDGPQCYLGLAMQEFPNLLMIDGPLTPFANIPLVVEAMADWIHAFLSHMRKNGYSRFEVKATAEREWVDHCNDVVAMTLVPKGATANSWLMGANIPGKAKSVNLYMGGLPAFSQRLEQEMEKEFPSFEFS